jgi:nicotinate dehydrogenase subunit B
MTTLTLNGVRHDVGRAADRQLLAFLREEMGLTGAKPGCGEGACGACSVLCDGELVRSCVATVGDCAGRSITTVEGLARPGSLHPLQQGFIELDAMQCGYCTAGMIVAAAGLLAATPEPDEDQVKAALEGNVCRCCAYQRIVRAVRRGAELAQAGGEHPGAAWQDPPDLPHQPPSPGGAPWDLSPAGRRAYFDLLPDGLVVELLPQAQGWSASGGAWVHVGGDGLVTAFTGKVEVGQGTRTALSLLVAEELRVPIRSVRLVMGDTDLCPYDMGTFGSRGMPDAGPLLQGASAAAREALVRLAAERWGADPALLVAAEGGVRDSASGRSAAYADLVRELRRVETVAEAPALTPAAAWRIAGRPGSRVGAFEVVTGARRYPSDLSRPGMLEGCVLRPPAMGATLRSVDLAAARAMAGVTVVRKGDFVGVAGPDAATARQALSTIKARWGVPEPPAEAELADHLRSHPVEVHGWEGGVEEETGDPDAALARAPVRLSATYTTSFIAHVPMETRVVIAEWSGRHLTLWTGTQVPFGVRQEVAEALGLPEERVRVVVPDTGGAFGGKHVGRPAIEAARLARAAARPVHLRYSREEEFTAGYFRPAAVIDMRSGADSGGEILAWEHRNYNSGAFALATPYEIPNQRHSYQPADSPLPQGSYRALSATANLFARESHMDEVAHALGVDPLELRLHHLEDERLRDVFQAAAKRAGWIRRSRSRGRGTGIAGGIEKGGRVATCAEVEVGSGGEVRVLRIVTAFECGAVVNPTNLENQVEGAAIMGLGGALFEAVHFEGGRLLNPSMASYRVPRFSDAPVVEAVLLDRRDLPPAGGGETPLVAVAPALANAIFAAAGVRLRSLPLLPDGKLP